MTPEQITAVTAKITVFDRRTFDAADLAAWYEILAPFDVRDCLDAVAGHFASSSDWLMPVHVVQGARRIQARRQAEAGDVFVPVEGRGRFAWDALPSEVREAAAVAARSIHPDCPPWDRRAVMDALIGEPEAIESA